MYNLFFVKNLFASTKCVSIEEQATPWKLPLSTDFPDKKSTSNILYLKISLPLHFDFTEVIAQLVRASDCGSEGRGFKSH